MRPAVDIDGGQIIASTERLKALDRVVCIAHGEIEFHRGETPNPERRLLYRVHDVAGHLDALRGRRA